MSDDIQASLSLTGGEAAVGQWANAHADVILHTPDGQALFLHNVEVRVEPTAAAHSAPARAGAVAGGDWGWGHDDAELPTATADTTPTPSISHTAIISLDSTSPEAETLFRSAIVSLDAIPGNEVQGISPLYHVTSFDGPDSMAAVIQLSTHLGARELIGALGAIEAAHADQLDLDLVDMPGVTCDEPDCRVPWPTAREHAAVLAPWLDMDPDARLNGDPVSYLLALAPDAGQVGMLSDNWVLGGQV